MQAPFTIREATSADLPELQELASECAEAPAWTSSIWQQVLQSAREAEPRRIVLVAWLESRIAGFIVLHKVAAEGELENLGVALRFRRGGIGRQLCEACLVRAKEAGLRQVHLEVRESNKAALALYGKLGFEVEGKRPQYYTAPREAALLLMKRL